MVPNRLALDLQTPMSLAVAKRKVTLLYKPAMKHKSALFSITELLRETDPRIITNYMMVRLTGTFSMELGDKYDDAQQV